ncbi:PorP/SprF family type IX secretion system membrane protein [Pedobacter mendelii]|uniref:Membrane protein n=1 Tax=Pedobacter mendelii TaxID=1908240 RepID=A0ABQ2BNE2_9SPHI|nr:type IX secretion system membrane protein PorP/SprF [Pedobacter mendelii]GGI28631.1 membrane protein [Pedobacter mendelii]
MKKNSIKRIIIIIGIILSSRALSFGQQSIQFSQYIFNSLSVNPAYAGYKEELFAQMALRAQWTGIDGAPKTGQVSIDGLTNHDTKTMGLGLQITADKLGPQSANSIYFNYAYRIRLDAADAQRLCFGIAAGLTAYGLDGAVLDPISSGDQSLPSGMITSYIPDARFGIYYYNPKWYLGASVMDLISGDASNSIFRWDAGTVQNLKRKRSLYVIAGTLFNFSEQVKLRPSLLWKEDFKGPSSLDLNAMFIFNNRFWLGGGYRTGVNLWDKEYRKGQTLSNSNSVSGIIQFYANDRLRIGYSYDYIISGLSSVQNGTHEITLGLTFPSKTNRILSPRFF